MKKILFLALLGLGLSVNAGNNPPVLNKSKAAVPREVLFKIEGVWTKTVRNGNSIGVTCKRVPPKACMIVFKSDETEGSSDYVEVYNPDGTLNDQFVFTTYSVGSGTEEDETEVTFELP